MRKIIYSLLFFCIVFLGSFKQPSSSIDIKYKLYYKGKEVSAEQLCKEFSLFDAYDRPFETCDSTFNSGTYVSASYSKKTGYFWVHLGSIYPPFTLQIMKNSVREIMTICFPYDMDFTCDSLPFLPGKFVIENDSPLKKIDLEECRKKYEVEGCGWKMKIEKSK